MNVSEFRDLYSGYAVDEVEFAKMVVSEVSVSNRDDLELVESAKEFLGARDDFISNLEYNEIEIG